MRRPSKLLSLSAWTALVAGLLTYYAGPAVAQQAVRVLGTVTVDTELMSAFAGADNVANPTTGGLHTFNYVWDGATWDRALASLVTEYTVDATAPTFTTIVGTFPLGLYKDFDGVALPNTVSAEGKGAPFAISQVGVQYVMAVNEDGSATGQVRLWDGTDTALVQADGDLQVECSNCSGSGAAHTDNAAFTGGTDDVAPMGALYDTTPPAITDGNLGAPRMDSDRVLWFKLFAALPAGTNNIGDVDVLSLPALPAGTNNIGDVDVATIAAGDNNIGNVDVVSLPALPAGTNNIGDVDVLTLPSVTIGTFPDNEPFNLAQWAGTTATGGNGASTAGSPRVVLAQDSGLCNPKDISRVAVAVSASGNTELVALTASQTIYVCDVTLVASGTVAAQLVYGTGTACATGETDITGPMDFVANTGWTHDYEGRLKSAEANALCLELSGAVAVNGVVTYRKLNTF